MKNSSQGNDTVPPHSRSFWEDVLVYGFCIAGIVFFLNAFRVDLFKTLTRQAENPIGTITFKYKAAHRRFVDRVLWDRLRKESPVYAGDFIRTAELSEATVAFEGGKTILNLPENSLIQLHNTRGNIRVDINEGGVGASAEASALVLVARHNLVIVETGAVVKAALDGGDLMLRVMEGAASFSGPGGAGNVSAGETVALNQAGSRPVREAAALSPRPQARFIIPHPGKLAVPFRWSRGNLPPETITLLEIAEDSAFSWIVFSGEFAGDAAFVELEPGSYFWRVSPVNDSGTELYPNTLSFKILSASAPVLISPAEGYRYQFRTKSPSVRFHWMETEEAAYYILEAADNPEMTNPVLSQEVRGTSFYFPGLGQGTWHWRARPVFPAGYEGTAGEVLPASFDIVQSAGLGAPELWSPQDRGMVNLTANQEEVYFSWRPDAEACSCRILVSANPDLRAPVINAMVRDNFYACRLGRNGIAPGQYYWAVLQTDIEGNDSALSPARSLIVLEAGAIQHPALPSNGYIVEVAIAAERPIAAPPLPEPAPNKPIQEESLPPRALPLELLPRPAGRLPEDGKLIGAPELRANRRIAFSWEAVTGATGYLFVLENALTGETIVRQGPAAETTLALEDLTLLDVGPFAWRVEAVTAEPDGEPPGDSGTILRRGEIGENRFIIDFSLPGVPSPRKPGILYGRE